jgi:hypothetical protein
VNAAAGIDGQELHECWDLKLDNWRRCNWSSALEWVHIFILLPHGIASHCLDTGCTLYNNEICRGIGQLYLCHWKSWRLLLAVSESSSESQRFYCPRQLAPIRTFSYFRNGKLVYQLASGDGVTEQNRWMSDNDRWMDRSWPNISPFSFRIHTISTLTIFFGWRALALHVLWI